eukprot:Skav209799  [mRNA]  locus=scaffold1201:240091:244458:- [translate_table: standard]
MEPAHQFARGSRSAGRAKETCSHDMAKTYRSLTPWQREEMVEASKEAFRALMDLPEDLGWELCGAGWSWVLVTRRHRTSEELRGALKPGVTTDTSEVLKEFQAPTRPQLARLSEVAAPLTKGEAAPPAEYRLRQHASSASKTYADVYGALVSVPVLSEKQPGAQPGEPWWLRPRLQAKASGCEEGHITPKGVLSHEAKRMQMSSC